MKFLRFLYKTKPHLGVYTEDENSVVLLNDLLQKNYPDFLTFIALHTEDDLKKLQQAAAAPAGMCRVNTGDITLLAPIERPIHDIICVGVNYRAHLEETQREFDTDKFLEENKCVYFSKRASVILGSGAAVKGKFHLDQSMDYEAELAVVIGKHGRDISPAEAEAYIFGYSIFNDFTARKLQKERMQWYLGKSVEGYSAMGPVILSRDRLPFPVEVAIASRVNGELRQHSNTRLFIHNIPQIIAELSKVFPLEPGDIIATGTPAGVGMGFDPPKFLHPGDEVVCEIPEIGQLINKIQ